MSKGRLTAVIGAFVFAVGIILTGSFQQPLGSLGFVPPKITVPSINDFVAEYSLTNDGAAAVELRFVFEPGTEPQTGPVIKIPVQVATENTSVDRVYPLGEVSVTDDAGAPVPFRTTRADGIETVFVGDVTNPIATATGYHISYAQSGVITHLPDHDVFSWAPISSFDFAVKNASIAIVAPVQATALTCSTGSTSSAWPCYQSRATAGESVASGTEAVAAESASSVFSPVVTANSAVVRNSVVPAGSNLSMSLNYPKGTFGDSVVYTASPNDRITPWSIWMSIVTAWQAFTATPIVFWSAVVALFALIRFVITRRVFGAVPASHRSTRPLGSDRSSDPPAGLAPWAIGLMTDRLVTRYDVAAMVIELARRGVIGITKPIGTDRNAHGNWTFELLRPGDESLSPAERELVIAMFAMGKRIRLDSLVGDDWSRAIQSIRVAIVAETTTKPWFSLDTGSIRRVVTVAGWIVAALAIVPVIVIGATGDIRYVIAFVALIASGAILVGQGRTVFRRRRPPLSSEGEAIVAAAQAYADHLADIDGGAADSVDLPRDLSYALGLDVISAPERWVTADQDWTTFAVGGGAIALVTPHSLDLLSRGHGRDRSGSAGGGAGTAGRLPGNAEQGKREPTQRTDQESERQGSEANVPAE